MQTRRDFIKGLGALVIAIPAINLPEIDYETEKAKQASKVFDKKLPDLYPLYLSKESLEDIRNWGVDQIDEVTRREIYQNFNSKMV